MDARSVVLLAAGTLGVAILGRYWLRWFSLQETKDLRRRYRSRIAPFKRETPKEVRDALLADAEVATAVAEHARSTGASEVEAWKRARDYAEEIVPNFNLISYYRLAYGIARFLVPMFYKVSVGYEAREALDAIPRNSIVLYLMNHRSNADYVVVTYVLSGRVAISYAVGEWARIWPLEAVFKSFGAYFIRRKFREPLYHKVLERYVQLITRHGVTQGIFLEGGLSRDGRFRPPKIGLLDYILGVKRDRSLERPLTIIPVAINYDRVLEDRSLLREIQQPQHRLSRLEQMEEVASYVTKVSMRFLVRRARRYGRACVNFGAPIDVDAWLRDRPGVLELPREQRLARIQDLADEVMAQIGDVMPVTPVCLVAETLLREPADTIDRPLWERRIDGVRDELRSRGAPIVGDERSASEILDRALVMLTLRRIVTEAADGYRIDRTQDLLLRYYANSIAHYFDRPPLGAAAGTALGHTF